MSLRPFPTSVDLPLLPSTAKPHCHIFPNSRPPLVRLPGTVKSRVKNALKTKARKALNLTSENSAKKLEEQPRHSNITKVVDYIQLEKLLTSKRGLLQPRNRREDGFEEGIPLLRHLYENWSLEPRLSTCDRTVHFGTDHLQGVILRDTNLGPSISLRKKEAKTRSYTLKPRSSLTPSLDVTSVKRYPDLTITSQGLFKEQTLSRREIAKTQSLDRPESCMERMLFHICGIDTEPSSRSASVPRSSMVRKQTCRDTQTDTIDLDDSIGVPFLIAELQSPSETDIKN